MFVLRPRQFSGARTSLQAGDNPAGGARPHSYLESGSYIVGNFSFGRDAHIKRVIIGDITAAGTVTIGEGARVTSQIRASSVVVAGKVTGDIIASERIEIRRTGLVFGNLTSPILLIETGAGLEGDCSTMAEQSSYSHEIESELVQMGFPFFQARDQRVIRLATEFPHADQAMQADAHGILRTRNVFARFSTIPCGDCLKPIRWWNRRIWLVDGERCAHLQCWNGQLFLKALVADQIRRSQLMAVEIGHSLRSSSEPSDNGSTKDEVRELRRLLERRVNESNGCKYNAAGRHSQNAR